jgi:hypothetical protein
MTSRSAKNRTGGNNHHRIARAIFAAAESMGITDRKLLEEPANSIMPCKKPGTLLFIEENVGSDSYCLSETQTRNPFSYNLPTRGINSPDCIALTPLGSTFTKFLTTTPSEQAIENLISQIAGYAAAYLLPREITLVKPFNTSSN